MSFRVPDYLGGSLVNLVAELESRLIGSSAAPPLHKELSTLLPEAATYVLFLIDGLGALQLSHRAAAALKSAHVGEIEAPFPTTTTVSWASIATGRPPIQHGLIGYQLFLPETSGVVYTIKWTRGWGEPVSVDHDSFLPQPNLWERLTAGGIEPITVQPGNFAGSNLSNVLFRGCRFESAYTADELVAATTQLATSPGRLIVTYLPHVDVAAHVYGQSSTEYAEAVTFVSGVWEGIARKLADHAVLIGTADHGHVDYPPAAIARIRREHEQDRVLYGDSRAMFVKGDGEALAAYLPATWLPMNDIAEWWGPGPAHPEFAGRSPDGALMADEGHILMHRFSDDRMVGHHGGLTDAERLVPLLVATRPR